MKNCHSFFAEKCDLEHWTVYGTLSLTRLDQNTKKLLMIVSPSPGSGSCSVCNIFHMSGLHFHSAPPVCRDNTSQEGQKTQFGEQQKYYFNGGLDSIIIALYTRPPDQSHPWHAGLAQYGPSHHRTAVPSPRAPPTSWSSSWLLLELLGLLLTCMFNKTLFLSCCGWRCGLT